MNKLACRYAIVQFMPYPETGEFANAGIVLASPKTGFFDFRLETRRYARITNFFEELDGQLYRDAITNFGAELKRVGRVLAETSNPEFIRATFEHLVHPREAIVRFGPPRAILVDEPKQAVDELFDYYIGRNFVTKAYQEALLEKKVCRLVNSLALSTPFREERIGNEDYTVKFPLVQMDDNGMPSKLIKPLFLAHDEPNKIYTHGDSWLAKIRRLRHLSALPSRILFAIQPPDDRSERRLDAFNAISGELTQLGVRVVDSRDNAEIQGFASA